MNLLVIGGSLLGTIVGGLIAYNAAQGVARKTWQRERQEKLDSLRREALAAALEWIEPMRNAEAWASGLVMSSIRGEVDDEDFQKKFPYLLGELVKRDLTGSQRAVLPQDVYARGHNIIRELEDLRCLGLKYGAQARVMGKPMSGFPECSAKLDAIKRQITELEDELRNEFKGTFKLD